MTQSERDSLDGERVRELARAERDLQDHRDLKHRQYGQVAAVLANWNNLTVTNGKTLCSKRGAPDALPLPAESKIAETVAEIDRLSLLVSNLKAKLGLPPGS